jgi:sec-independent protein translocase protein TatA
MNTVFFAWLNGWEIVALLAIVLVLFGARKLPELARGLGQGIREFKKASREVTDELQHADEDIRSAADVKSPEKTVSQSVPASPDPSLPSEHKA